MKSYIKLFERDLDQLADEIRKYPKDAYLWITEEGINNSAGNLALHLCGNLNHFIGAVLGNTGYVRDREAEFDDSGYSANYLIDRIYETKLTVYEVLKGLDTKKLTESYPEQVFGYPMTVEYFLIHLLGHLNYHLGQINYHRRLLV